MMQRRRLNASFHVRPSSLSSREFTMVLITGFLPLTLGANARLNPQCIVARVPSALITGAGIVGRMSRVSLMRSSSATAFESR